MQNKEKRVVFCDMGGVGWQLKDMNQWWEKLYYASTWSTAEEFRRAKYIALKVAWEPFERGEINSGEFQIIFQRILGLESMSIEDFWHIYVNIMEEINMPFVECLWKMRERGITLALLSNIDGERHKYIREKYPDKYRTVVAPFHYLFFSYQVHSRKPEPEIYRHAFREVSVLPQCAYYIDDYPPNINNMAATIHDMPRENILLYQADRHQKEAVPFFRRHELIA